MSFKIFQIKVRSFWYYQIIGWIIYYAADVLQMFSTRITPKRIINVSIECVIGFVLTILLRLYYRRIGFQSLSIFSIIARIILCSVIIAIFWHFANSIIIWVILQPNLSKIIFDFGVSFSWIIILFPVPFGWSLLYLGIKLWLEWDLQKERAEKASMLAQQAQLQMLRYQLNPHFLFNALNSIRALIEEDAGIARTMITELSEFLRYSLISRNRKDVKLKDELEAIRYYLSIEKKRYEEKLDVAFEVAPETEDYPILSFLIHPLVENAVKYGMQTSSMPLKIRIKAIIFEDRLRISIINSGVWLRTSIQKENGLVSTGTGLENVRARLRNAFPDNYRFETFEKDGNVNVVLEINNKIQNKNEEKISSNHR
jgi:hypothetical protein